MVQLDDAELEINDIDESRRVIAECDPSSLAKASFDDFPDAACSPHT